MKRVLFKKILVVYLIMAPLLFLSLDLYLSGVVRDSQISMLRESLVKQARLISDGIPLRPPGALDDRCREIKAQTGARVTIIDSSGRVLGDSDEPSAGMDNHLNRPEIKDAAVGGIGTSTRVSATLKTDLFYLAISSGSDSGKRYVRLSIPLRDVENAVGRVRTRIFLASVTALFIAILVGLVQAGGITKSIAEISLFSREVAAGNFERRLFLKEKGEMGELARNMNEMAQELKTRLRQGEEEKRTVEAILKNLSDGLMLVDRRGRILLCNDAARRFFALGPEVEGSSLAETLRNADIVEAVRRALTTEEAISQEVEVACPAGRYLMVTASPFSAHSVGERITGVVLALHDITRLRRLEEMRKDFVANVSHEIKTPITAIKGFAETLIGGALEDRENAYKFIETIRNHSGRLDALVSDLLTLSRIELGDIRIEKTSVSLDAVVDAVFTTLGEKAARKGLFLEKEVGSDVHEILADRDRLIQILLNLVDNGIKFTETGGVAVRIHRKDEVPDNAPGGGEGITCTPVEISVEDTGPGVPRRHLPRLGERFYRVDNARSRELGGTGLGLAIVKHLVKAHGWDMKIQSIQGKGTTVTIHATC